MALVGRGGASGHAVEFDDRVRGALALWTGLRRRRWRGPGLETPLVFRIHPRGLRLLVPEGNLEAALRRRSRAVHVGDLLRIARGATVEAT